MLRLEFIIYIRALYFFIYAEYNNGGKQVNSVDSIQMGERLKKQRLLIGYSREKLAELVDITPRFCYDIELGLKNMSLNTLCKLSNSLHISTDYILFGFDTDKHERSAIMSLIETCPDNKLEHLEQIISHYIQAVNLEEN